MAEINTERAYTATIHVEIVDGILAPKKIVREIELHLGSEDQISQQLDAGLTSLDKAVRLNLLRNFRDVNYLTTTGWKQMLASRDN